MTIPEGTHTFVYHGYSGKRRLPTISLAGGGANLLAFAPLGHTFTLTFDTTQRYCSGWHDLATGKSYLCPKNTQLPSQYSECRDCQQKTGFNPAFYHSDTISPQQQARNQQPHLLYLAHFGSGVVKVGISWAERGYGRLLDQGARSCLILKTFATAQQARQAEAHIASLPGIVETLQSRQKLRLLNQPYNAQQARDELLAARECLANELQFEAEAATPELLDNYYLTTPLQTNQLIDLHTEQKISGNCIGMVGGILITAQDDLHFMLSLSKLRGYKVVISTDEEPNQHAPQQASLF